MIKQKLCYKKMFKKMIDLDIKNSELIERANIGKSTFYKLKNGENVNTDVLLKICNVLDCDICDIVEVVTNGER